MSEILGEARRLLVTIRDERLAISDERLATVFLLLTTDDTDYTVFFKAIAHSSLDGHSQLRTMADGWHGF